MSTGTAHLGSVFGALITHHTVTEWVRLEGTPASYLVQLPCSRRAILEYTAWDRVQMVLEYMKSFPQKVLKCPKVSVYLLKGRLVCLCCCSRHKCLIAVINSILDRETQFSVLAHHSNYSGAKHKCLQR